MLSNTEHPQFSIENLNYSIAEFLKELFPNVPISFGPTQQVESLPRFYILYYNETRREEEIDNTSVAKMYVNIVYEEEFNKKNLFSIYENVAQTIDNNIHQLTYNVYDENTKQIVKKIRIDSHENRWKSDLSSVQYKFEIWWRLLRTSDYDKIEKVNSEVNAITH